MNTSLDSLIRDFHDFFLDRYKQTPGAVPEGALLAFQSLGTILTPSMFILESGEFSPRLATEEFSLRANKTPLLDGSAIEGWSMETVALDEHRRIYLVSRNRRSLTPATKNAEDRRSDSSD